MSAEIKSIEDLTSQVKSPDDISIACDVLPRGVDNYHIDVEISDSFTLKFRECLDQNLRRLLAGRGLMSGNSEVVHDVRDAYTDLMKTTLHRTRMDLEPAQVHVLQFGIVKFVISEIRQALDKYSEQLDETLGQQQYSGSRSLMATQEKVQWFRKHAAEFQFRLTRLFLRQLQREENNQLKDLRSQMLGKLPEAPNIMFNPLLFGRSPRDPLLLLDYYAVWPGTGANFDQLSQIIEGCLKKDLKNKPFTPLKSDQKLSASQAEVYDELGGLFGVQQLLGPSEDQKDQVNESFSWLDHPGNIRLLFDPKVHDMYLRKSEVGFTSGWSLKSDLKKLQRIPQDIRKSVGDQKSVKAMLASYALREKLAQPDLDLIDIDDALAYVAGNDSRRLQQIIDQTADGASALHAKLEECKTEFDETMRETPDALLLRMLTDYCRYRLHLKYYRLAHRMFNRVSVITEPEKIQLAKAGGHLYRLLSSEEVRGEDVDEQPEIIRHTILKADVRGSTTVTEELMKKELNPASYFSLRFFNPINERLATYGATKVFIEGDAVILATYEYNNAPDEWFSVSRACGLAKEMLDIVASKNAHSKQTGLPMLEIGIGICFSDARPLFLFDENRPIMISKAIGDADRASGCSWRLRESYDAGNFNVGALLMDESDRGKGEKGQDLVRYNVNGIVLDEAAFNKLESEVHFRRLKARSDDAEETFFVGQYPDVQGKLRDLVVRQGRVGTFSAGAVNPSADTGLSYYEVLPNSRFASQIIEMSRKKAS